MEYIIDVTNEHIQQAMKELGINESELKNK